MQRDDTNMGKRKSTNQQSLDVDRGSSISEKPAKDIDLDAEASDASDQNEVTDEQRAQLTAVYSEVKNRRPCVLHWCDAGINNMDSIQDDGYTGIVLTENDIARYRLKFGFDEHKILQYRDAFSVFDLDNDGVITANELSQVLLSLGYRPSIDEANALVAAADRTKRGCIDFPSFLHVLWKTVGVNHLDELKEVFTFFDSNSDGYISAQELYDIMQKLGVSTTLEEAEEMIKEADINNDGLVDFQDFQQMLTSQGSQEYHMH